MNCPQCGQQNLPGSAYCDSCGYDLTQAPAAAFPVAAPPVAAPAAPASGAVICPQCGATAEDDALYCDACGAKLDAAAAPAAVQAAPPAAPPVDAWAQPAAAVVPPSSPPAPAPAGGGVCFRCGQALIPGAAFCDNCGAQQASAPAGLPGGIPPSSPAPGYPGVRMRLVVAGSGVQLPLTGKREYFIGREDPIGRFFPDADLTPHGGDVGGVSRRHAKITVSDGQVLFEDLDSINGSFVDQVEARPGQPVPLRDGAEIRLGKIVLVFRMG